MMVPDANDGALMNVGAVVREGFLASLFHGKFPVRPEAPASVVRRVGDTSTRPQSVRGRAGSKTRWIVAT